MRGGIEQYCGDHPHTSSDLRYGSQGASLLCKLLEGDARWPEFVAQLGHTLKGKLQQTALACLAGAVASPQAAVHEFGCPAAVVRWCLRVLH